jgi:hypothetical protein
MRELGDRSCEHSRDAGVHGVPALMINAHTGLRRKIGTGRHGTPQSADRLPNGTLLPLTLPRHKSTAEKEGAENEHCMLPHHLAIIAAQSGVILKSS